MKKKQSWTVENEMNRSKTHRNWNTELKKQRIKLRHEHNKRKKEGEEKAHEDGRMVGWSRHLEDGDSKMSVQAATWGNQRTLKIRLSEEGTKLSNSLSKIEYSFSNSKFKSEKYKGSTLIYSLEVLKCKAN